MGDFQVATTGGIWVAAGGQEKSSMKALVSKYFFASTPINSQEGHESPRTAA